MHSKTDQEGQGRPVALPYGSDPLTCPVRNLRAWLEAAAITAGPVFRAVDQFGLVSESALHPDSIGWIVKRAAERGGLEAMEYASQQLCGRGHEQVSEPVINQPPPRSVECTIRGRISRFSTP
jgi:hypothetical protein